MINGDKLYPPLGDSHAVVSGDSPLGKALAKQFNAASLMTKREHFSIEAMNALINHRNNYTATQAAHHAVSYADALLKELEK